MVNTTLLNGVCPELAGKALASQVMKWRVLAVDLNPYFDIRLAKRGASRFWAQGSKTSTAG